MRRPKFRTSSSPRRPLRRPRCRGAASDPDRARWNGQPLSSGGLSHVYGFTDRDGPSPTPGRYLVEVQKQGSHPMLRIPIADEDRAASHDHFLRNTGRPAMRMAMLHPPAVEAGAASQRRLFAAVHRVGAIRRRPVIVGPISAALHGRFKAFPTERVSSHILRTLFLVAA